MFVDRVLELQALKKLLDSKGFCFLVLYGRRRIGKTTLLNEAIKDRNALFYFASKTNNLEKLKEVAGLQHLASDWGVVLAALKDKLIVLDEYPYMLAEEAALDSELQKAIDLHYKQSGTKLILCGSTVSVLKESVLDYASPLYGRKTAQMKLKPIKFVDTAGFYPKAGFEDLLKAYSFAGGVPQYQSIVEFPFEKWLEHEVAREDSILVDEVEFLVKTEFRKEKTYYSILEAISRGRQSFAEIRQAGHFRQTDITPYLHNLKYVELVKVEQPLFPEKKQARYVLADWFTKFWFNFISPKAGEIALKRFRLDKQAYSAYLGRAFEETVRQLLAEESFSKLIGFLPARVGRQWGRTPSQPPEKKGGVYEIDAAAVNEEEKRILFAECKWRDGVNAERLARELAEKTRFVKWRAKEREETLAIFAKSFSKKITEFEGKPVKCFDAKTLQEFLTRATGSR